MQLATILAAAGVAHAQAWVPPPVRSPQRTLALRAALASPPVAHSSVTRGSFVAALLTSVAAPALAAEPGAVLPPTEAAAREQVLAIRKTLQALLSDYPAICAKGGDEIRRYLGTVGTTSPLFKGEKAFKVLVDDADDIVEYTELLEDYRAAVSGAESDAYSSIFVEFSSAKGSPDLYFGKAKKEIATALRVVDGLIKMLGL